MPDLAKAARRLYRRLAGAGPEEVHPGTPSAAAGAAAVARAEELAGAVFAAGATGRSRLAAAMGLAAAGERAAVLLTGAELTEAADLLAAAAERRLPLVVHWAAGAGGHAPLHAAAATGALVLFAADVQEAADLAWIARRAAEEALLPAVVAQDGAETWASVQDVLLPDAASAARLLGGPGDPIHAPTRAQEMLFGRHRRRAVRWHDPARPMASGTLSGTTTQISAFAGSAAGVAASPLAGIGSTGGTEAAALAAAGRRAYLDCEAVAALERAFEAFGGETGRRHQAVTGRRVERAGLVLVAVGATAGTAAAIAERQGEDCPRVGVVALRCLRPFPEARLAELLRWSPAVAVVERLDAPLAEDGPLAAEVRAALWRWEDRRQPGAGRSGSGGRRRDAKWPYGSGLAAEVSAALGGQSAAADGGVSAALPGADAAAAGGEEPPAEPRARNGRFRWLMGPKVASVLAPGELRAEDLAALCGELPGDWRSPVHLGVAFDAAQGRYPKRDALRDALAAAYPGAAGLGLRRGRPVSVPRPPGALAIAFHGAAEAASGPGSGLAGEAAALLHATLGGRVRSCPGGAGPRGERRVDRLQWLAGDAARPAEPGPGAPVDVAVWAGPGTLAPAAGRALVARLASGASLLIPTARPGRDRARPLQASVDRTGAETSPPPPEAAELRLGRGGGVVAADTIGWWTALSAEVRDAVSARGVKLSTVDLAPDYPEDAALGALLGLLAHEKRADFKPRKALEARRARLADAGLPAPEIDRRLAALQAGLDRVRPLPAAELAVRRTPEPEPDPVPTAVRRATPAGRDSVDGLPRFWDQVGVLLSRGEADLLTPDPYLATGTLPALSGALRDASAAREMLPAFEPAACTGCGACWAGCPHGAVVPLPIGAAALLDQGIALAKRLGAPADALRMAAGKLAAALDQELAASGGQPAGGLLDAAFARTLTKLPLPEERKTAVREAFAAVREELAALPLARTEVFAGGLFTLALDPDRCTGCGVCVAACEPEALIAAADTPSRTREARRLARLIEELPEPAVEAVAAAREHPEAGRLAGALLTRAARAVAAGGDGAEAGSGEALAVRQALGAAAFHLAPARAGRIAALDALREELAAAIHEGLARALPDRDLDALARGLATLDRPEAELAELTGRIQAVLSPDASAKAAAGAELEASGRVDVARLRRLVAVAGRVADLRLRLGGAEPDPGRTAATGLEGDGGSGRGAALFGLVLAGGPAAWGASFPHNAFAVPVTGAPPGAAAGLARGLAEAARREAATAARLAREARLVLAAVTPSEVARADEQVRALAGLSWAELSADERNFAPPVFLIASEEALARELSDLLELLSADLPVTVLSLAATAESRLGEVVLGLTLAGSLTGSSTHFGQTSIAHPDQLEGAVASALAAAGPALLRVLAPSPSRGGFAPGALLARARETVESRAFQLFVGRPDAEAGSGLDLQEGPEGSENDPLAAVERAHLEEVAALRAGYEARLAELSTGARLELAREVRARLLDLATRPKPLTGNGAPVAVGNDPGTAGAAEAVAAEALDEAPR